MRAGITDLECCRGWGHYTPTSVVTQLLGSGTHCRLKPGLQMRMALPSGGSLDSLSTGPCSACYITFPSSDCLPEAAILFSKRVYFVYARPLIATHDHLACCSKPVPSPRRGSRRPRYRGAPQQNERTPRAGPARGRPRAGPPSGGSCLEDLIASSPHS